MGLEVWIPTFGIPMFGLFVNVLVRIVRKLPQSAVPDLILSFAMIDALIAMDSAHFEKFVQTSAVKEAVPHVYGFLALVVFFSWIFGVIELERQLLNSYKATGRMLSFRGIAMLFASLVWATIVVFATLIPFSYRT